MRIIFSPRAWEEYLYWQQSDRATLKRVSTLIRDTLRNPYSGIGKPEPLRHEFQGFWSRRIDEEHRLIYRITDEGLEIAQCRYHY